MCCSNFCGLQLYLCVAGAATIHAEKYLTLSRRETELVFYWFSFFVTLYCGWYISWLSISVRWNKMIQKDAAMRNGSYKRLVWRLSDRSQFLVFDKRMWVNFTLFIKNHYILFKQCFNYLIIQKVLFSKIDIF